MMCNCQAVCRIPDIETEDGRWPMPHHSAMCEDYEKIIFKKISLNGSGFICTIDEWIKFIDGIKFDDDAEEYKHEEVYLTKDQFERLPEFGGW